VSRAQDGDEGWRVRPMTIARHRLDAFSRPYSGRNSLGNTEIRTAWPVGARGRETVRGVSL
jgi:hypothetical protein